MLYGALFFMAKPNYTPWALAMLAIGLLNVALLSARSLRLLEFNEIATALRYLGFRPRPIRRLVETDVHATMSSPPRSRS